MTANDVEVLMGFRKQRDRLRKALDEFNKGDRGEDMASILEPVEFQEVQQAANLAVENRLGSMLGRVEIQVQSMERNLE